MTGLANYRMKLAEAILLVAGIILPGLYSLYIAYKIISSS
jgi:hypothetical protein